MVTQTIGERVKRPCARSLFRKVTKGSQQRSFILIPSENSLLSFLNAAPYYETRQQYAPRGKQSAQVDIAHAFVNTTLKLLFCFVAGIPRSKFVNSRWTAQAELEHEHQRLFWWRTWRLRCCRYQKFCAADKYWKERGGWWWPVPYHAGRTRYFRWTERFPSILFTVGHRQLS